MTQTRAGEYSRAPHPPRSLVARLMTGALLACALSGCSQPWNNPYPAAETGQAILYSAFVERPKHLDPAQSYSENEATFNAQIYEPVVQYHYFKRPYQLIPLTAKELPKPIYLDAYGGLLPDDAPDQLVAQSVYTIRIRDDRAYQPHPALARDGQGHLLYHQMGEPQRAAVTSIYDLPQTGSRALRAEDYVYEIKRLAHPRLHSPIFGLMAEYIVGMEAYAKRLRVEDKKIGGQGFLDLRKFDLPGAEVIDASTYRVRVKGKYPQFVYWLAMPFFAPVPWEADSFYSQPGFAERNVSLDWYPIGTGPYYLAENNPNSRMVLRRNPHFPGERYPAEGESGDRDRGLLKDAGKTMPFIDTVVFSRERESIPYWNKFLQGWYDTSGISSDNFDQAVQSASGGDSVISEDMAKKGIRLETALSASINYVGFNMLDPVVGGSSERARKLRQALSIAIDFEENIAIFANGRGIPAMGPIAPGIWGYRDGEAGLNPLVYDWVEGKPRRKSIAEARRLLAEAGYPDGRDAATGQPLVLNFDATSRGPDDKAELDWMRKQFGKLNIQLVVRGTDYNRFQEKVRKGTAQIFEWGWNADYPDPENFLFLLYGPQSRVKSGGENSANYSNPEFDRLFEQMKNMPNGSARQAIIDRMLEIVRQDAPWIWGLHPKRYSLVHGWLGNVKPNQMARNGLKYQRLDVTAREAARAEWNAPVVWPLLAVALLSLIVFAPAWLAWRRKETAKGVAA